ncbi:hypothetical protein LTS14_010088 [Recurvomyces mirabilis]|uniref:uncharacterized protein n=1 Tax=Recurvomyces mirabilis TaxID=574656 RepID=UPI002DE0CC12|nr:hypothetical protein LTS14_010088 [Recurvomyces mirabilis]
MSGVVPIYLGQQMLHDALDMCDQLEIDQGKNETIDLLRDKTNALLQADLEERERAREEVEESQDASEAEDEGEDGGIWLEDAVEDAMMRNVLGVGKNIKKARPYGSNGAFDIVIDGASTMMFSCFLPLLSAISCLLEMWDRSLQYEKEAELDNSFILISFVTLKIVASLIPSFSVPQSCHVNAISVVEALFCDCGREGERFNTGMPAVLARLIGQTYGPLLAPGRTQL